MRIDLSRHVPPGFDPKPELQFYFTFLIIQIVVNLAMFLMAYFQALGNLYWAGARERTLIPGAVMSDFAAILDGAAMHFFLVLALCMPVFALIHYLYHRQGSKSIYLMRRLPNRWELHRRCLTLPLAGLALCALTALVLLLAFLAVYLNATPKQCLPPLSWQKIWSVIL